MTYGNQTAANGVALGAGTLYTDADVQSWARDNFLALRQRQRDNVTEPQGPVRDQKKFEKQ